MTHPLSPSTWSAPVPLRLATDESRYGGKSSQLNGVSEFAKSKVRTR